MTKKEQIEPPTILLSMVLSLYFFNEDQIISPIISARTFNLFQYGMEYRKVLFKLTIEAAMLLGSIKARHEEVARMIKSIVATSETPSFVQIQEALRYQAQATHAVERLAEIERLISTCDWKVLESR